MIDMENSHRSNEAALQAIGSHVITTSEYPKWVQITICAEVQDDQDGETLFAWAAGEHGGPICPDGQDTPCWQCSQSGQYGSGTCQLCEGVGHLKQCSREHYAASQVMSSGMTTWEWETRKRLETVLAVLEAGDPDKAAELLRCEIDGFEPILGIE